MNSVHDSVLQSLGGCYYQHSTPFCCSNACCVTTGKTVKVVKTK